MDDEVQFHKVYIDDLGEVEVSLDANYYDAKDADPVRQQIIQDADNRVNFSLCYNELKSKGISGECPQRSDVPVILSMCKKHSVDPQKFGIGVKAGWDGNKGQQAVQSQPRNGNGQNIINGYERMKNDTINKILGGSNDYADDIIADEDEEEVSVAPKRTATKSFSREESFDNDIDDVNQDELTKRILNLLG